MGNQGINHDSAAQPPRHVGEKLQERLEARGLTQSELADIIGKPVTTINEIVKGKRSISPEFAQLLQYALDTPAREWLQAQTDYDLAQVSNGRNLKLAEVVKEKSIIYRSLPIRELIKRNVLELDLDKTPVEDIKQSILIALDIPDWNTIEHELETVRFRSSDYGLKQKGHQIAWILLGKKHARKIKCADYSKAGLQLVTREIGALTQNVANIPKVLEKLNSVGVRVVFLPHFSKTRVDGAVAWMEDGKPVIIMSLRFDRIDNFYFTLVHEIGHIILHGTKKRSYIDEGIDSKSIDPEEKQANEFVSDQWNLKSALHDLSRYLLTVRIILRKSAELKLHPGILIGALQHEGMIGYGKYRNALEPVKAHIPTSLLFT